MTDEDKKNHDLLVKQIASKQILMSHTVDLMKVMVVVLETRWSTNAVFVIDDLLNYTKRKLLEILERDAND